MYEYPYSIPQGGGFRRPASRRVSTSSSSVVIGATPTPRPPLVEIHHQGVEPPIQQRHVQQYRPSCNRDNVANTTSTSTSKSTSSSSLSSSSFFRKKTTRGSKQHHDKTVEFQPLHHHQRRNEASQDDSVSTFAESRSHPLHHHHHRFNNPLSQLTQDSVFSHAAGGSKSDEILTSSRGGAPPLYQRSSESSVSSSSSSSHHRSKSSSVRGGVRGVLGMHHHHHQYQYHHNLSRSAYNGIAAATTLRSNASVASILAQRDTPRGPPTLGGTAAATATTALKSNTERPTGPSDLTAGLIVPTPGSVQPSSSIKVIEQGSRAFQKAFMLSTTRKKDRDTVIDRDAIMKELQAELKSLFQVQNASFETKMEANIEQQGQSLEAVIQEKMKTVHAEILETHQKRLVDDCLQEVQKKQQVKDTQSQKVLLTMMQTSLDTKLNEISISVNDRLNKKVKDIEDKMHTMEISSMEKLDALAKERLKQVNDAAKKLGIELRQEGDTQTGKIRSCTESSLAKLQKRIEFLVETTFTSCKERVKLITEAVLPEHIKAKDTKVLCGKQQRMTISPLPLKTSKRSSTRNIKPPKRSKRQKQDHDASLTHDSLSSLELTPGTESTLDNISKSKQTSIGIAPLQLCMSQKSRNDDFQDSKHRTKRLLLPTSDSVSTISRTQKSVSSISSDKKWASKKGVMDSNNNHGIVTPLARPNHQTHQPEKKHCIIADKGKDIQTSNEGFANFSRDMESVVLDIPMDEVITKSRNICDSPLTMATVHHTKRLRSNRKKTKIPSQHLFTTCNKLRRRPKTKATAPTSTTNTTRIHVRAPRRKTGKKRQVTYSTRSSSLLLQSNDTDEFDFSQ